MAKKIKIDVDVNSEEVSFATDEVLTLTQKIKLLKKELQTIPEGTQEWQVINKAFNDNKDALDRVNTKSKELFGTISLLPGPLGNVANSVDNAINSFKIFASIKTSDLNANLKALGDDFKDILSTLGKVTGITKAYTVLNNALSASFVKLGVAEETAAVGARAFSAALISTGVGALVVALGLAAEALYKFATASDDAAEKQKELNEQISKTAQAAADATIKFLNQEEELAVLRAQNAGKSEKEILDIRNKYSDARAARYKKLNEELVGIDNAAATKAVDNAYDENQKKEVALLNYNNSVIQKNKARNDKVAADNKAAREKAEREAEAAARDKEQREDAAFKVQTEAYVSTLSERNQSLYKIEQNYEEQRKTLIRAGIYDFAAIEEQKRLAILEVNKKYDDEEAKKRDEDAQKRGEKQQQENELYIQRLKERKEVEAAINKQIAQSWIDLGANIAGTFRDLSMVFKQGSDLQKTFAIISVLINAAQAIGKINMDAADSIASYQKAQAAGAAAIAQGTISTAFGNPMGVAQIATGKIALATATAGMAKVKINKGLQIASVGASSAAQIAAILAAKKSAAASSSTGGAGEGSSLPAFAQSSISAPTMGTTQSQTGTLAGIVNQAIQRDNSRDRPIRAYVVQNDITTAQQLDRRLKSIARLG